MAKDRSLVRASDLASWHFCQRAWWLANVEEMPHERPEVFVTGNQAHAEHGRQVRQASRLRKRAILLIGVALLLLIVAGLLWWLS